MSVIDRGQRTVRKPRRCAYCDDPIPVGARVHWWTWTDAGKAETSYGHPECVAADHWYAAENGLRDDDELMDPGDFYREVLPAYREHVRAKLAREDTDDAA